MLKSGVQKLLHMTFKRTVFCFLHEKSAVFQIFWSKFKQILVILTSKTFFLIKIYRCASASKPFELTVLQIVHGAKRRLRVFGIDVILLWP